jgi:hypothetical protein
VVEGSGAYRWCGLRGDWEFPPAGHFSGPRGIEALEREKKALVSRVPRVKDAPASTFSLLVCADRSCRWKACRDILRACVRPPVGLGEVRLLAESPRAPGTIFIGFEMQPGCIHVRSPDFSVPLPDGRELRVRSFRVRVFLDSGEKEIWLAGGTPGKGGEVAIREERDLGGVFEALRGHETFGHHGRVEIWAAPDVPLGRAVRVLEAARSVGFGKGKSYFLLYKEEAGD